MKWDGWVTIWKIMPLPRPSCKLRDLLEFQLSWAFKMDRVWQYLNTVCHVFNLGSGLVCVCLCVKWIIFPLFYLKTNTIIVLSNVATFVYFDSFVQHFLYNPGHRCSGTIISHFSVEIWRKKISTGRIFSRMETCPSSLWVYRLFVQIWLSTLFNNHS